MYLPMHLALCSLILFYNLRECVVYKCVQPRLLRPIALNHAYNYVTENGRKYDKVIHSHPV